MCDAREVIRVHSRPARPRWLKGRTLSERGATHGFVGHTTTAEYLARGPRVGGLGEAPAGRHRRRACLRHPEPQHPTSHGTALWRRFCVCRQIECPQKSVCGAQQNYQAISGRNGRTRVCKALRARQNPLGGTILSNSMPVEANGPVAILWPGKDDESREFVGFFGGMPGD